MARVKEFEVIKEYDRFYLTILRKIYTVKDKVVSFNKAKCEYRECFDKYCHQPKDGIIYIKRNDAYEFDGLPTTKVNKKFNNRNRKKVEE